MKGRRHVPAVTGDLLGRPEQGGPAAAPAVCTPGGWRDASPLDRLAGEAAPMLLVCSDLRLLSCPNAREFMQRARSFGATASVLPVALSHGQ